MRRGIAQLAAGVAGALVLPAALLVSAAVTASAAAAAPLEPTPLEPTEVCIAAEPAPFPDRGTTHALGIDCLTTYADRAGDPIVRGLDDGTFGTARPVTRAQFASLLLRFLTVADPGFAAGIAGAAAPPFDDVDGTTHAPAIAALAELGVLAGRADGRFAPNDEVSRGAAASALARTLEVAGTGIADRPRRAFEDQGETHARAIGALADLRVVAGVTAHRFATGEPVTRGQAVTLLARAAQHLHDTGAFAPDPAEARPPTTEVAAPVPRPTPAAVHAPRVVAAIGDSITQASGAARVGEGWSDVLPGGTEPERSWATGTAAGLDSMVQRLQAADGMPVVGINLSANWARMTHAVEQAARTPATADLVTVQLGGNDLCRPDLASMTDPDDYERQFRAALVRLTTRSPAALVQVSSVPDLYRLWELLRDDPLAVGFWNGVGPLPPLVPCQSLLADATSDAPADQRRRDAVRERGRELNRRLADVCAEFVRCRFDGGALWRATNDPARFGVHDISRIDYFHPSFAGQRELARVAWESGFDHTRTSTPLVDVEVLDGVAVVDAWASAGVAGLEHRRVSPRARRPAWTATVADTLRVPLGTGPYVLEVRAIDRDGNVSSSRVVPAVDQSDGSSTSPS